MYINFLHVEKEESVAEDIYAVNWDPTDDENLESEERRMW